MHRIAVSPVRRLLIVTWFASSGPVSADPREPSSPPIDAATAFALSDSLTLLTKTPLWISQALAETCVTSTAAIAAESSRTGPHALFALNVYASTLGVYAMTHERAPVPVGTIVLKEKLLGHSVLYEHGEIGSTTFIASDWTGSAPEAAVSGRLIVAAVGGMVKRAPGFDRDFGDWEYFYADARGGFTKGRLPECRDCHARAADSDHLFSRGSSAFFEGTPR